jgi:hypothetical protein
MWSRRTPPVLLVVLALTALTPLAHATPADPTWLPGCWDNSDHDDVVILASSVIGTADAQSDSSLGIIFVSFSAPRNIEDGILAQPSPPSLGPRAPPTVQPI